MVSGDFDPDLPLPAAVVNGQEVRVYQSYNGKQLFKITLTPVARAGQNFALSPDGLRLAVLRESLVRHAATKDDPAYSENEAAVEVYALPALTAEDKAAVKEAQTMAPADTGARIDLALVRAFESESARANADASAGEGEKTKVQLGGMASSPAEQEASESEQQSEATANSAAGAGTVVEGDPQPTGPRQAPSLYGPNEAPQKPPP
jgi:hypothetical protein